jgi:hypothetical protein
MFAQLISYNESKGQYYHKEIFYIAYTRDKIDFTLSRLTFISKLSECSAEDEDRTIIINHINTIKDVTDAVERFQDINNVDQMKSRDASKISSLAKSSKLINNQDIEVDTTHYKDSGATVIDSYDNFEQRGIHLNNISGR